MARFVRSPQVLWSPEAACPAVARAAAVVRDRCTCTDRDPELPPLAGHEPDCSLWNTGWLT